MLLKNILRRYGAADIRCTPDCTLSFKKCFVLLLLNFFFAIKLLRIYFKNARTKNYKENNLNTERQFFSFWSIFNNNTKQSLEQSIMPSVPAIYLHNSKLKTQWDQEKDGLQLIQLVIQNGNVVNVLGTLTLKPHFIYLI